MNPPILIENPSKIFANKSFELEKFGNENEISFEIMKERDLNSVGVRRKSCHCDVCGNCTKFQEKNMILSYKIPFHRKVKQNVNKNKKNRLNVQNIVSLKRSSFTKILPKKLSFNIFFILFH